jgi:hypothetical protein
MASTTVSDYVIWAKHIHEEVWRYLSKRRRGELVSLKVVESASGVSEASEAERREKLIFPPLGKTQEERDVALHALLNARRQGYSSEGRTMTREEMHER